MAQKAIAGDIAEMLILLVSIADQDDVPVINWFPHVIIRERGKDAGGKTTASHERSRAPTAAESAETVQGSPGAVSAVARGI